MQGQTAESWSKFFNSMARSVISVTDAVLPGDEGARMGADGITANIVLPERIATGRITFLDEQKAKREGRAVADVTAESTASIPMGHYGMPQDCGDAVAFLASARASYITGSVLRIDGGLIASI